MKNLRQKAIVEIIEKYEIDTQQRLAELLQQRGFEVTQATVSRDIKDMSLIKVATDKNTYKYALPHAVQSRGGTQKFHSIFHDSITSAETAGNILVIKTYPGMANAVCAAMDQWVLKMWLAPLRVTIRFLWPSDPRKRLYLFKAN